MFFKKPSFHWETDYWVNAFSSHPTIIKTDITKHRCHSALIQLKPSSFLNLRKKKIKESSVESREGAGTWWVCGKCVSSPRLTDNWFCKLHYIIAEEKSCIDSVGKAPFNHYCSIFLNLTYLTKIRNEGMLIHTTFLLNVFCLQALYTANLHPTTGQDKM